MSADIKDKFSQETMQYSTQSKNTVMQYMLCIWKAVHMSSSKMYTCCPCKYTHCPHKLTALMNFHIIWYLDHKLSW